MSQQAEKTQVDSYQFKAEIRQLLDILVHSLYKERDIFLRELISNASDALTRMHFEMLTNQAVHEPQAELAVHVDVVEDGEVKRLVVKDSGIGMTREELVQNLGTIAQSGAREFLDKVKEGEASPGEIIGQFGVGFYSVFMAADEVRVVSRTFRPDAEAAAWISQGDDQFRVEPADKSDRGTEIHITLKKDAGEFASEWKLRQIVKKHSDYVGYPIYVGQEQANQQQSLWRKPAAEATQDEYKQFYQQLTLDFEEPLTTIHLASDAPLHVRALLFIPAKREKSVLHARKEPGLKLYSHNILIQEYNQDLLPRWLAFVDGVVDSEDLPLNVSRETVQNTRLIRQLGKTLRGRVLRELGDMAKNDAEKYGRFWAQFGRAIKEGLAMDPEARDDVLPLFRFYSSHSDGKLTSLDAYVERMAEGQTDVYYVLGDDLTSVANSPHLDPFKARNLEVLYWVDPLDPFVAPLLTEYKGQALKNIDDPDLQLPEAGAETAEEGKEEETTVPVEADFNRFIGRCVTTLGDRVVEVRESKVLKNSPVRLVSPEGGPGREMARIYRFLDQEYQIPKKILEVNRRHPLVANLARLVTEKPENLLINLAIEQLYESALVQEGLHPNPTLMLPRIQQLLELAAAASKGETTGE
ncbi:MAG: molecular chaperone HtpG [Chloroflexi bacterium]|nr:molecular chaperone HtpG [Chloroflexota bacterium]MCI0575733.1 molecular chaperone HtpG [Chloroflexota bacterium]MCI0646783.1 molecular chaperone HtpG [Chloroflexota bacterium]MCI0730189.1 molecular chaperone HtpG [Chloroflexota bacterium]